MNTKVAVNGQLSPEYQTVLRKLSDLQAVVGLPINIQRASIGLVQAQLIYPAGNMTANDMVSAVLQSVDFNAMNFYRLLGVLQTLANTDNILKALHLEFYGEGIDTQQRLRIHGFKFHFLFFQKKYRTRFHLLLTKSAP